MRKDTFFKTYWYKPIQDKTLIKRERRLKKRLEKGRYTTKEQEMGARNSLYKSQLKKKATKAELVFGDYLWNNKIYFEFQKGFFVPFHRIADFYLPDYSLIIEIDGGYHKDTIYKDRIKDTRWDLERNRKTLRILNEEVFNGEFIKKLSLALLIG